MDFPIGKKLFHLIVNPRGGGGGGGGGTWVFFGWVCAARDSKLVPPFKKKFPLKLIPRSRIRPKTDTPF